MKRFIAFWVGAAIVCSTVLMATTFTKTFTVPTRKDQVRPVNQQVANLSYDFNALIANYNAMQASVGYGTLDIPLTGLREVDATGDVGAIAANGGILASDTTPILKTITGVSKKAQMVDWAASNSDAVMYQMMLPFDLKDANVITFQARVAADGTTDGIVMHVYYSFNEDDVTGDVTTDTRTSTSFGTITATIPAADVTTDSENLTLVIYPVAHTTNAFYMSGARLKYTRDF